MKNKGVIFSILFILCAGIFITNGTRRLVSSGTASDASGEIYKSAASISGMSDAPVPSDPLNGLQGAGLSQDRTDMEVPGMQPETEPWSEPESQTAMGVLTEPDLQSVPEPQVAPVLLSEDEAAPVDEGALFSAPVQEGGRSADSSVIISPLTGSADPASKKDSAVTLSSEECKKKLQEIDAQIKKTKESGIDPNTDSYKNMADYEYRLWDNELNTLYQNILNKMTDGEADSLRAEEREWTKLRDQNAHKAIEKYKGGTMESIEYTASMAESTRSRAYELLENYGEYLDLNLTEKQAGK